MTLVNLLRTPSLTIRSRIRSSWRCRPLSWREAAAGAAGAVAVAAAAAVSPVRSPLARSGR
eukprot:991045-Prymnesium_polylepis.1